MASRKCGNNCGKWASVGSDLCKACAPGDEAPTFYRTRGSLTTGGACVISLPVVAPITRAAEPPPQPADAAEVPPQWSPREKAAVLCGFSVVKVLSADGQLRLDIGELQFKRNSPIDPDRLTSRFVIRRLDGPSMGPVSSEHLFAVVTEDGRLRVDVDAPTVKPVRNAHESWATRLELRPLPPIGAPPFDIETVAGWRKRPLQYEQDVVGMFSTVTGSHKHDREGMLDIGPQAVYQPCPADRDTNGTRLQLWHVDTHQKIIDAAVERRAPLA